MSTARNYIDRRMEEVEAKLNQALVESATPSKKLILEITRDMNQLIPFCQSSYPHYLRTLDALQRKLAAIANLIERGQKYE